MPNHVLQVDASSGGNGVEWDQGTLLTPAWFEVDVAFNAAGIAAMLAATSGSQFETLGLVANGPGAAAATVAQISGALEWQANAAPPSPPAAPLAAMQFYRVKVHFVGGSPASFAMFIDGAPVGTDSTSTCVNAEFVDLAFQHLAAGALMYFDNFIAGTTEGSSDLGHDDFENGNLDFWNSFVAGATIIVDPGIMPPAPPPPPTPVPRSCRPNVPVRFLVTDLNTVPTTWLDNLSLGATLTYNLLQPATIAIPFRSNDPRVNTIFAADGDPLIAQSNRLIYAFFREGATPAWVCRGAGIAMSPQDQADADVPVTHMVFYDPWQYLLGRPCFANTSGAVIGPDGLLFPATQMGHIAATLLKNAIVSEGVGCFIDAGVAYGGTSHWGGTIETTPIVDYTVQQGSMVGDAWNQIVALEDPSGGTSLGGCDIVLTPIYDPVNRPGYTHELSIYNLAGDDLHTSPIAWGEFVRSATTADRQHDGTPGQFVNVADFHVGQGGYPVPIGGPPPDNSASVALYRPYWESKFFPQQVSAPSVLALAQQELQLRKQGKRTFTVNPDPLRSGVPLRDYNIGDRIQLNMPAALRVHATGRQRIQTIPVDVNPDGMTRVQGLLTSPDWRGV